MGSHDTGFQLYPASGPQPFWQQGSVFVEDSFSTGWVVGGAFEMIQTYYICYALYFCYYYISSTFEHQGLDPGVGDPLSRMLHRTVKGKVSKTGKVLGLLRGAAKC